LTLPHDASPAATPTGNAYDKYGVEHPIERRLVDGFLRALDSVLPSAPPRRVLEVGVGEGEISGRVRERYPDATVVGIDLLDKELAEQWRARGAIGAFADVARLPFPDDAFDLVLGIEVLEHVASPGRALTEIRRVGRESFVLSVPREPVWRAANMLRGRYLRDLGNTPGHVNHWSTRRFRTLIDTYLELRATRTPFPWTLVAARRRPPPLS
jgi:SAM-dependent methyltransferase